jgi:hypothetical protein
MNGAELHRPLRRFAAMGLLRLPKVINHFGDEVQKVFDV